MGIKVNVEELRVKRAKNRDAVAVIKKEYGEGMDEITRQAFHMNVPFDILSGAVVILHEERTIGMCGYGGRTIYGVCVDEEYRNNGICHHLMEECISDMKEVLGNKCDCIKLFSDNPVAQKIYESLGFVHEYGEETKYYELKI